MRLGINANWIGSSPHGRGARRRRTRHWWQLHGNGRATYTGAGRIWISRIASKPGHPALDRWRRVIFSPPPNRLGLAFEGGGELGIDRKTAGTDHEEKQGAEQKAKIIA